ncbi:MAG: GTP-binding protein [Candidatus Thiodiazotropha sp.]
MTNQLDTLSEPASTLIPLSLLTGFLGRGKTTLPNHLVSQPEMADTLVIINEFGEMALDHELVAHSTENLGVLSLEEVLALLTTEVRAPDYAARQEAQQRLLARLNAATREAAS